MGDLKSSFTSASVLPSKLLVNHELIKEIRKTGKIPPYHIQINITNVCNLSCPFCSCSNRKKDDEISYEDLINIMKKAKDCGCMAVTITGGGEPLLHKRFSDIINGISELGIEIGIVTNGTMLHTVSEDTFDKITWIRISSGDHRTFTEEYKTMLESAVRKGNNVDWAFSHVISKIPNYDTIRRIVNFAKKYNFTHVRLVSDILDNECCEMNEVKNTLRKMGIDGDTEKIIIYQGRKIFMKGTKRCLISLLKPTIAVDGYIYPCCGTQYALKKPSRDYDESMRMIKANRIDELYDEQINFDGSVCDKCFYNDYNVALEILKSELKHKVFI